MEKPYVVSADIFLLLKNWVKQSGFILPAEDFFCQLREEFVNYMGNIFTNFELVAEKEIQQGINSIVSQVGLPVVSLDRIYTNYQFNIDITRLIGAGGNDLGLGHRAEMPKLYKQIEGLKISGLYEVVLVDDVLFSGSLLERVIALLARIGIHVPWVCVGIGIDDGIRRISNTKCQVRCVRRYADVIDEVCERDFYPGVPLSGRLLGGGENIGAPYLLPFGDTANWASIPSGQAKSFSQFCLQQTILLFREIEKRSGKDIGCQELPRKVFGLPKDKGRYIVELRKIL